MVKEVSTAFSVTRIMLMFKTASSTSKLGFGRSDSAIPASSLNLTFGGCGNLVRGVVFSEGVVLARLPKGCLVWPPPAESAVSDAVGLRRQAELFGQRQARVRGVKQRVLFIGAAGDAVFARA